MLVLSASGTGRIMVLPDPNSIIASKIRIQDSDTGFVYQIRIHDSHNGFVFKLMQSSMNEYMPGGTMQGIFSVADEGCPSGGRACAGFPFGSLSGFSVRGHQQGVLLVPYAGCPSGGR